MVWMTGAEFLAGAMMGLLLFATVSRPALSPTRPSLQWVPVAITMMVKQLGHSPPSSNKV